MLPEVPTISPEERKALWTAAATFDRSNIEAETIEKLRAKSRPRPAKSSDAKLTPWDDYNSRGDWLELLSRHNWTSTDGIHWKHPAAAPGHKHSATLRQASGGDHVLRVFSTSTALEAEKSHSLFNVAVKLDFNGDPKEATKALRKSGYGH